ncbi:zinc finger BED domain-containing protein 4-like [Lasioglossum baleicum]|uniref:zinc finger BED domain-containing protein 4-like n=2 Tax=Lasioglossum baleicum TaxID=434251 RepID=UPI003FCD1252
MDVDNVETGAVASSANSVAVDHRVRRKSRVWRWFNKINKDESVCNLCQKTLKCKRASTTTLKRHIEYQHREEYFAAEEEEETVPSTASTTRHDVEVNLTMLETNSTRSKVITKSIAEMMIRDCQPFCIVEDVGFKNLIRMLEPRYKLPSRTTFSESIVPAIYKDEKKRVATILEKDITTTETFAFTTDGWTSKSNESYLSVTVHYMNNNFVIQNFTLKIHNVTESHTGEHINSFLRNTVREWNLDKTEFHIYFVTDNAANMVKAVRLSPTWERIPCFAHTLQLTIKDAMKPCTGLASLLQKCRRIVGHFHRSSTANEKLKMEQTVQYPERTPLKLIIDCQTRWNSQFDMINRLINVRRALHHVLCEPDMPDLFTAREWTEMEKYSTYLKLFKEATEMMSVQDTPTLPSYIPTVHAIRDRLTKIQENDSDSEVAKLKRNLITELDARFSFATNMECLVASMLLDPRIKDRLLPMERKDEAKAVLNKFATTYSKPSTPNADETVADENVASSSSAAEASTHTLFAFFKDVAQLEGHTTNIVCSQTDAYISEKLISPESCILEWWNQNSTRYPDLAIVARNLLSVPATQTYSERLFSLAGNIVTERRSSLLSEKVEQLCFVFANQKL